MSVLKRLKGYCKDLKNGFDNQDKLSKVMIIGLLTFSICGVGFFAKSVSMSRYVKLDEMYVNDALNMSVYMPMNWVYAEPEADEVVKQVNKVNNGLDFNVFTMALENEIVPVTFVELNQSVNTSLKDEDGKSYHMHSDGTKHYDDDEEVVEETESRDTVDESRSYHTHADGSIHYDDEGGHDEEASEQTEESTESKEDNEDKEKESSSESSSDSGVSARKYMTFAIRGIRSDESKTNIKDELTELLEDGDHTNVTLSDPHTIKKGFLEGVITEGYAYMGEEKIYYAQYYEVLGENVLTVTFGSADKVDPLNYIGSVLRTLKFNPSSLDKIIDDKIEYEEKLKENSSNLENSILNKFEVKVEDENGNEIEVEKE